MLPPSKLDDSFDHANSPPHHTHSDHECLCVSFFPFSTGPRTRSSRSHHNTCNGSWATSSKSCEYVSVYICIYIHTHTHV